MKRNDKNKKNQFEFVKTEQTDTTFEKIDKYLSQLECLCNSHLFTLNNNVYSQNSIKLLITRMPDIIKNWPKLHISDNTIKMSGIEKANLIIDAYENIAKQLTSEYTDYMVKNNIMQTYQTMMNYPYVDLTGCISPESKKKISKLSFDALIPSEEMINYLRSKQWFAFIPPYKQVLIRLNRKAYVFNELLYSDESKRTFKIKTTWYNGDKYDWMIVLTETFTITFKPNNDTWSCDFSIDSATNIDELMMKYVNNMKWSDEQKNLWYAVTGTNSIEKIAVVDLNIKSLLDHITELHSEYTETDINIKDILTDTKKTVITTDINELKNIAKKLKISISILAKGYEVPEYFKEFISAKTFIKTLQTIAMINHTIMCNAPKQTSDNEFKYAAMIIKASTPPTIPRKTTHVK